MDEFIQSIKYKNNITNDTMRTLLSVCGSITSVADNKFVPGTGLILTAFPNPVSGQLNISFRLLKSQLITLELYNIDGSMISVILNKKWKQEIMNSYRI